MLLMRTGDFSPCVSPGKRGYASYVTHFLSYFLSSPSMIDKFLAALHGKFLFAQTVGLKIARRTYVSNTELHSYTNSQVVTMALI